MVRCNNCMEKFREDDIQVVDEVEFCPRCGEAGCLMDADEKDQ